MHLTNMANALSLPSMAISTRNRGGVQMPRHVDVTFELPDEVAPNLRDEDLAAKAKEAFILELLREHEISQGKAAELLGIDRHQLFDLMAKYQVPVIDMTPEELQQEFQRADAIFREKRP
jgi:DNA-binding NtrC family response regulator